MANLDFLIQVSATTEVPPPPAVDFGLGLVLGEATFSPERTRSYTQPSEVDADLTLSTSLTASLKAMLAQSPRPSSVKAGRRVSLQSINFLIVPSPTIGDSFSITIDATTEVFVAISALEDDVATALRAQLLGSLPVNYTVSGATNNIIVTENATPIGFNFSSLYTPIGGPTSGITESTLVSVADDVIAIEAEDIKWYGLVQTSRVKADIEFLAADIEARRKIFMGQTSDADVPPDTAGNVLANLKALNYKRSGASYYSDDATYKDASWMGKKLSKNLDEGQTVWTDATLAGVAIDDANLTATEVANILANNGNVYLSKKDIPVTGVGTFANGGFIDLVTTKDWFVTRTEERWALTLANASNVNKKVPYTSAGMEVARSVVQGSIDNGELGDEPHFDPEANNIASVVRIDQVLPADKAARDIRVSYQIQFASAIQNPIVNGQILLQLPV